MWNKEAYLNHKTAARIICGIKDRCKEILQKESNISEYELTKFILTQFKENNLRTDEPPMVAFRENTARVHYTAKANNCNKLRDKSLIMIDLWAGLKQANAPFADVTWMYYKGKTIPRNIGRVFRIVKLSQDEGLQYIKGKLNEKILPYGNEIHNHIKHLVDKEGYGKLRNNYTGHSIGFTSPHGTSGNLNENSRTRLKRGQGYTLEPEIDIPNKFGIRLELDFYISKSYKVEITTDRQNDITLVA